ncbi:amylo-alpha-1,6-glucosidase [Nitrospira sp. Nam74]
MTQRTAPSLLPILAFPWHADQDPAALLDREWLVTNGLGGYASGTVRGVATRRHHGLFVPDLPAPQGRTMMLPRVDEAVEVGGRWVLLNGAQYTDGRIEGEGPRFLREFRWEGQTPVWLFDLEGCHLEKRVIMPYGYNTVYIEYVMLAGGPVRLQLRPFVVHHGHDASLATTGEPHSWLTVKRGRYEVQWGDDTPAMKLAVRPHQGVFVADDISEKVYYRVEKDRGYPHVENVFSPGYFSMALDAQESLALVASTEVWESLELDAWAIREAEHRRLEQLMSRAPDEARQDIAPHLVLAADQFIVVPASRVDEQILARASGHDVRTVIAGYHWFTDWGRDTMISLEGLTLCTGRHEEAKAILWTFSRYVKDGLMPNLFPEGQRSALYHTADATLWYFHALDRYLEATQDRETLEALFPILASILEHHVKGTDFGIGLDDRDGLLKAGAEGYQLTWMDAKCEGWVVTPRRGKPVEIQGLWYNALRLMASWGDMLGQRSEQWTALAERAFTSFNTRFWYEPGHYLYDVIDGEGGDDRSLRPNQIFAVSLRFPLLAQDRWASVVEKVSRELLTPVGLRSLARGHLDYKPAYCGDLRARDAAYHQGTVWAWLIGHYIDAWLKVHGDKGAARTMLKGFEQHLRDAGVGTISEIFDAEAPYHPRGCIAQAWSVAEVLRAYVKTAR